jgi:AcrR family transcriptional regulator
MSRKANKSDRHREILAAAKTVFARCGFDKATVDDIAVAASVSKGCVYCYFRDKEDLFCRVVENMLAAEMASALSVSYLMRSAIQRLDYLLEILFRTAVTYQYGNLIVELWALVSTNRFRLSESLASVHKRWRTIIKDILNEGCKQGELSADMDTEAAASLIMAVLSGTIVNLRFGDKTELDRLDKVRHRLILTVSTW